MAYPGSPLLQPDSLSQSRAPAEGLGEGQLSETERSRRVKRSSFTKGTDNGPGVSEQVRERVPQLLQEEQGRSCQVHGQPEA